MIRIETEKKSIKVGEYYVRVNGVYVVGGGEDLDLLQRIYAAKDCKRVVFEEKLGGKESIRYHYLSFDVKMYRVYGSIQGLLEQFGDVYVLDLYETPPDKTSVKKVVGLLERKNVVVFGVLLLAVVGVFIVWTKREKEVPKPLEVQAPPPPRVPQVPAYIPCRTNLPSFAQLFDYSDQVVRGKLIKSIHEKTIEMPLELMEVKAVKKGEISLPSIMDEREFNMQDMGDKVVFSMGGYDKCLMFIELNRELPLVVEELTTQSCRLYLEKSCVGER
jgi:hypothetical protein